MPTVLRIGAYSFFFFSNEGAEPPHIHVKRDNGVAKFWLHPVHLQNSSGLKFSDLKEIQTLVEENREKLLEEWNEYFGQ